MRVKEYTPPPRGRVPFTFAAINANKYNMIDEPKTPDTGARDQHGRFKKGHSGNPEKIFKTRPENAGRKPSAFKIALAILKEHGEALSLEDFKRSAAYIVGMSIPDLKAFMKRSDIPLALLVVAKSIYGDYQNKQMRNLETLLNRLYGMPNQPTEITTNRSPLELLSNDELLKIINDAKGVAAERARAKAAEAVGGADE